MKFRTTLGVFLIALLCCGCSDRDRFWYPISLKKADCSRFTGEIYVMKNSVSWRSWPYFLERSTKQEIELGTDCVFRKIKDLPNPDRMTRVKLNAEQREYLVEG